MVKRKGRGSMRNIACLRPVPHRTPSRIFLSSAGGDGKTSTCTWPLLRQADKLPSLLSDSRRGKLY